MKPTDTLEKWPILKLINLLKEVGVSEQQINEAKTPDDLLNIFKSLFGS